MASPLVKKQEKKNIYIYIKCDLGGLLSALHTLHMAELPQAMQMSAGMSLDVHVILSKSY